MRHLLLGLLAISSVVLTGCDETQKLARNVEGTWTSNPAAFMAGDESTATAIETMTFERDSTSNGGEVIITSLISATGSFTGSEAIMTPFSISAAAKSYISGHWTATDDDELMLSLDPATMTVDVDPDAVVVSSDVAFSPTVNPIDSIRPQLAGAIKQNLTHALMQRYVGFQKLDDVKIKGSELKFEVKDTDYYLHRQGPSQK